MSAPVTSIEVPSSGTVNYGMVDESNNAITCNASDTVVTFLQTGVIANPTVLNATTVPSLTFVSGQMQLAANGANPGLAGNFNFTYTPSNVSLQLPGTIGSPVTSIQIVSEP